jgi:hypothetical protein
MRIRSPLILAALLAAPASVACAMADATARLAAPSPRYALAQDTTITAHKKAQLDSLTAAVPLAQSVDSAVTRYCATKSAVGYMKAVCSYPGVILRLLGRAARAESLYVAPIDSTPPIVVVDSTPPPPDTTSTEPAPTPGPGPIFSHPFAPPSNGALLAEFPRDTVDASYPAVSRVVRCTNLQACLDTAKTGDDIRLAKGATFTDVVQRSSSRALWAVVRTDVTDAELGAGTMTLARAASLNLATIRSSGASVSALTVGSNAHHVRYVGVRFTTSTPTTALVRIGQGESVLASLPHHITLDRVVVDGGTTDVRRCVALDGAYLAVLSSTLTNCHSNNGDSQGILAINAAGPLRIEGNVIHGGHMAIMFGGADPRITGMVPSDIVVRGNAMCRPIDWKGKWGTKNIFESKLGRRMLIEGNRFCNVWPDGQTGFAMLLKSTNQDGTASWSQTADVTVRYNRFACAAGVVSLAANPDANRGSQFNAIPAARITIYSNVADSIGTVPCAGEVQGAFLAMGVSDAVIRDNWIRDPSLNAAYYAVGVNARSVLQGNVFGGAYGIRGEGGLASTNPNAIISGNTVVPWGTAFSAWPAIPPNAVRDALLQGVAP